MRRPIIILIVAVFILLIIAPIALPFIFGGQFAITGYDGPVARIIDIDHTFDEGFGEAYVEYIGATDAVVYPTGITDFLDVLIPCGLRAEIMAAPNVLSYEVIDEVTENIIDKEAETNTTKIWEVQKVKCSMSVVIETYGGGLADIYGDVIFWIQINDNSDSIFSTADEKFAYIVNVYTRDKVFEEGSMTVVPTAAGFDFELTAVETVPPPQWIIDGGYTSSLEQFKVIKFPIKILNAVPILAPGLPPVRYESYVQFDIGIDIFLFGYWEQTKDYREFEWPELPDFWGDLLETIVPFLWYFFGIVVTVLVIWKLKNPGYIIPILIGVWALVLLQTGFIVDMLESIGWW